jgi:CheY-like chemotaxis protein/HPt (histidine-containing phosphotransfer) domain-containing protein
MLSEGLATGRSRLHQVQPGLEGRRVAIVDDNATNRKILLAQTAQWGMDASAFASAAEAIQWINAGHRYDVALLDLQMPDVDGLGLAEALRGNPDVRDRPLIMLSSVGHRLQTGALLDAVLTKPVKPAALLDALESVTRGAEAGPAVYGRQPAADPFAVVPTVESLEPARPVVVEAPSGDGLRPPIRILLAEDNAVNQRVALGMLGRLGYGADLATNGHEVLRALEQASYDLVLMDIQMPEMDGLEAARHIRQNVPRERRPSIVAMTANAMTGDRDRCLEAGMDDYLKKPLRVEELEAVLEHVLQTTSAGDVPAASVAPAPAVDTPVTPNRRSKTIEVDSLIGPRAKSDGNGAEARPESPLDEAAIAVERHLRDLTGVDDAGFAEEVLASYLRADGILLTALEEGMADGDALAVARAVHKLKSSSAILGADALAAKCSELESMARAGRLSEAIDLAADVITGTMDFRGVAERALARARATLTPVEPAVMDEALDPNY